MAYNKVEILKILNWQQRHCASNQEVVKKYNVSTNSLKTWQKRYEKEINKSTTAIVALSNTNVELAKNNHELKNIERADKILEACFERLSVLIPEEKDTSKISTVMKTMLLYKEEVKPGSADSSKSRIEKMLELSEKRMMEFEDAKIVE